MTIHEITAGDHKLVKQIASLKEKKYRDRYGEFLVEGPMSVLWALSSGYGVKTLVQSSDYQLPGELAASLCDRQIYTVPPHIFAKMADTKTPQGLLCTCPLPQNPPLPETGKYIYCDRVRDPGNVGSIIRSADALGFDGVMLSAESVDPFNPKLVRSTMGSLFHIRLYTAVTEENLSALQHSGFSLTASALTNQSITSRVWQPAEKLILVVGNEAGGVSDATLSMADTVVKIPMHGSAESFNVAAAAAILMYEATGRGGCHD